MRIFLFVIFSILSFYSNAQNSDSAFFTIKDFTFKGNNHTNKHVIEKELDIAKGDTVFLKELATVINYNEKRLLSTGLFTSTQMNISDWNDNQAVIDINVRENWYWYPTPILETGDRNFNVWLLEEGMSLDRINYGLAIQNINFTGNGDKIKLKFQRGYNDKYELKYSYPYLGKKLGIKGQLFYAGNNEIAYTTQNNKLLFGQDADRNKMLTRRRFALGLSYRKSVRERHSLDLFYRHHSIPTYVTDSLTNRFFLEENDTSMKWFSLQYKWSYDNRIFAFYPEGGWSTSLEIKKDGLGIAGNVNITTIKGDYQKYIKHKENLISGIRLAGGFKLFDKMPYYFNRALGYQDDIIRGYELYVVDGSRWALAKYSLRCQLYSNNVSLGRMMIIKKLKTMPLNIYLRGNIEGGYVHDKEYDENNHLSNQFLYGGGPAIDMIVYHNFMASLEYNFNKSGESGFFLKSTLNF